MSIQLKTKEVNGKHVRKIKQINSNTSLYQNYKSTNKKKTFLSEEDEDFNFDSETHRELEIKWGFEYDSSKRDLYTLLEAIEENSICK